MWEATNSLHFHVHAAREPGEGKSDRAISAVGCCWSSRWQVLKSLCQEAPFVHKPLAYGITWVSITPAAQLDDICFFIQFHVGQRGLTCVPSYLTHPICHPSVIPYTAGRFPDVKMRETGAPLCVMLAARGTEHHQHNCRLGVLCFPSKSLDFKELPSRTLSMMRSSLGLQQPRKNHAVPLGERLSSYPQKQARFRCPRGRP